MSQNDPGIHIVQPFPAPPPAPEPAHQKRITRQKIFEIVVVVTIIVAGTGYMMWRNIQPRVLTAAPQDIGVAAMRMQQEEFTLVEETRIPAIERDLIRLQRTLGVFDARIELIGRQSDAPIEIAILWLTPRPEAWPPAEGVLQESVDTMAYLAQALVHSTPDALEKAVKTMIPVTDTPRPHSKGVAGTDDGWKLTYVTYNEFDELGAPQPALVLVLQSLESGSDLQLEQFNRAFYRNVRLGAPLDVTLEELGENAPDSADYTTNES